MNVFNNSEQIIRFRLSSNTCYNSKHLHYEFFLVHVAGCVGGAEE